MKPIIQESVVLVIRMEHLRGDSLPRCSPEELLRYFNHVLSLIGHRVHALGPDITTRVDVHMVQVILESTSTPSSAALKAIQTFRTVCAVRSELREWTPLLGDACPSFYGGIDSGKVLLGPCDPYGEVMSSATSYADEAFEANTPLVIGSRLLAQLTVKADIGAARRLEQRTISDARRAVVCLSAADIEAILGGAV